MSAREHWDAVANGWRRWWPTIECGAHHVTGRMLDLSGVAPGHRVLDVATGIGEPALSAATRVGASGFVVATDVSPQMLAIARERAAALQLQNVAFAEADAERLSFADASFDAVLCRWGLASLSEKVGVMIAIRRLLTSNGAFVTSVWEAGARGRPLANLASAAAAETLGAPQPRTAADEPSPSAAIALREDLERAGFSNVRVEDVTLTLKFPSADHCLQYLIDVSPYLAALHAGAPPAGQHAFRRNMARRLQPFRSEDGRIRIPNVCICGAGRS